MHRASLERRRTLPRLADPQRRLRVTQALGWISHKLQFILKSEVGEGFLRSGTAKSAVPPVEMTGFGWWMMWETLLKMTGRYAV
jgi:hypothetical protein